LGQLALPIIYLFDHTGHSPSIDTTTVDEDYLGDAWACRRRACVRDMTRLSTTLSDQTHIFVSNALAH